MKVQITFKDPDALYEFFADAGLSDAEEEAVRELAKKYISSGEYLTIELDIAAQTGKIVET